MPPCQGDRGAGDRFPKQYTNCAYFRRREYRLHDLRDVVFDEGRATLRAGHLPQVLVAFPNAALGLIHALGATKTAATCRQSATQPLAVFLALGTLPDLE